MTHSYSLTGMTCTGCEATVQKLLSNVDGVVKVNTSLQEQKVDIEMNRHISVQSLKEALSTAPHYHLDEPGFKPSPVLFWSDRKTWWNASKNTFSCLIGCTIGDFGMIIFLQTYYPHINMYMMMALAMLAGLATSIILETVLLKINEKFSWVMAFQTAIGMSFLSMLAMELAENATDLMLTGGKVATSDTFYWFALSIALLAGFLVPLPYNYYKLKKHGKACH